MAQSTKQPPFFLPSWTASNAQWLALSDFQREIWVAWSKSEKTRGLDLRNTGRPPQTNFQQLGTNRLQDNFGGTPFESPPGEPLFDPSPLMASNLTITTAPLVQFKRAKTTINPIRLQLFFQMPGQSFNPTPADQAVYGRAEFLPAGGAAGDTWDGFTAEFVTAFGDLWNAVDCQCFMWLFEYSEGQVFYLGGWQATVAASAIPQMSPPTEISHTDTSVDFNYDPAGNSAWSVQVQVLAPFSSWQDWQVEGYPPHPAGVGGLQPDTDYEIRTFWFYGAYAGPASDSLFVHTDP